MTGEAKTGARIRPIGTTGITNAGAGSEKVRAAGGKGFAMLGHAGSHGRSQVARVGGGGGGGGGEPSDVCVWDTFTRTVAGGWGTGDVEQVWINFEFYAEWDAPYVDGSWGVIRHRGHGDPGTQSYVVTVAPGPYLPDHESFTMTARFGFRSLPSDYPEGGAEGSGIRVTNEDGDYDGIQLEDLPSPRLGLTNPSGTLWTSTTYTVGTVYFLRWEHTWGGTQRVKIWKLGDAEPDWALTGSASARPVDSNFSIVTQAGGDAVGQDYTLAFDYISLCGMITDYFHRTGDDWGTTDGNIRAAWSTYGASTDGTTGLLTIETGTTDAGAALFWTPPTTDPDPAMDIRMEMSLNRALAGGDGWGEWFTVAGGSQATPYTGDFNIYFSGVEGISANYDGGTTGWSTIPVDMTDPFLLRITCAGPSQPTNVYVWAVGGTQPGTPTLTFTGDAYRNRALNLYMTSDNAGIASPLTLGVEWLDVAGSRDWL